LLATVPVPVPEKLTVKVFEAGGAGFKVSATLVLALTVKLQVDAVPLHPPPCHPAKTIDGSGVTVRVTLAPEANEAEQPWLLPVRQEIP